MSSTAMVCGKRKWRPGLRALLTEIVAHDGASMLNADVHAYFEQLMDRGVICSARYTQPRIGPDGVIVAKRCELVLQDVHRECCGEYHQLSGVGSCLGSLLCMLCGIILDRLVRGGVE